MGISPDIIVLRTDEKITDESIFKKVSLFCNVKPDCVIENLTADNLYEVPLMLEEANFSEIVCRELNIKTDKYDISEWTNLVNNIKNLKSEVNIALVGKYVELHDAYLSVVEALHHAGYKLGAKVNIKWVASEEITEENVDEIFKDVTGIILPGGFGVRGIDGMILTAKYARENNIPYFGICLGMQIMCIEFARNVLNKIDANSKEFDDNSNYKIIDFLDGQTDETKKGGTLRLGAYPSKLNKNSKIYKLYEEENISERHRHRYEFNNKYRDDFISNGMNLSGLSPDESLVEAVEVDENNFYIGVQYHPEFKSRPNRAHPLFLGFIKASMGKKI